MPRIFYVTDLHGSEICWKKFLNAGAFYKADVVILGGDRVADEAGLLQHPVALFAFDLRREDQGPEPQLAGMRRRRPTPGPSRTSGARTVRR